MSEDKTNTNEEMTSSTPEVEEYKPSKMDVLMSIFAKIGNQRHLSSIRDGFATFLPFIIVGSFGVLLNSVFFSSTGLIANFATENNEQLLEIWQKAEFYLSPLANAVSAATMDFMAVYISFLIGYYLTGTYGENQLFGGLISVVAFLTLGPIIALDGALTNLSAKGVLMALFASLCAPSLYILFSRMEALKIKMPPGVPQAVSNSFNVLIPIVLTVLIFASVQPLWGGAMYIIGPGRSTIDVTTLSIFVTYDYLDATGQQIIGATETISVTSGQLFDYVNGIVNVNGAALDVNDAYLQSLIVGQLQSSHEQWTNFENVVFNNIDKDSFVLSQSDIINADYYYVFNAVNTLLFAPLSSLSDGWFAILLIMLLHQMFWVFGIHGGNILNPFIYTFWVTAAVQNTQMLTDTLAQGGTLEQLIATGELASWTSTTMDNIIGVGGSGATLGFMFSLAFFGKSQEQKQIARLSIPTGLFGINEPVVFGVPIMLNPFYLIPWMLIAPIWALIVFFSTELGLLNPVTIYIPWTTPPILGPLLATQDWRSIIFSVGILSTSFFGYLPFAIIEANSKAKIIAEEQGITVDQYFENEKEAMRLAKEESRQARKSKE